MFRRWKSSRTILIVPWRSPRRHNQLISRHGHAWGKFYCLVSLASYTLRTPIRNEEFRVNVGLPFAQLPLLRISILSSFHQFCRDSARKVRIAILFHVELWGVYPAAFNGASPFLTNMQVVWEIFICVKVLFCSITAIQEPSGRVILQPFFLFKQRGTLATVVKTCSRLHAHQVWHYAGSYLVLLL